MAKRPAVPKFGNWNTGGGEDIGYTVCFDNARKGKGGPKPSNPNDPLDNDYLVSEESRSPPRAQSSHPKPNPTKQPHDERDKGKAKRTEELRHDPRTPPNDPRNAGIANRTGEPRHDPRTPSNDPGKAGMANRAGEQRHDARTPPNDQGKAGMANKMGAPSYEPQGQEPSHKPPQERRTREDHSHPGQKDNSIDGKKHNSMKPLKQETPGRSNFGESHQRAGKAIASYEQSHPQNTKSPAGGSAATPNREEKGSHQSTYGTPGRARMTPALPGNRNHEKGPALPKFGEWNKQNASNADGYTQIFAKAREEKQQRDVAVPPGAGMSPIEVPKSSCNEPGKSARDRERTGGCCFSWGRK